MSGKQLAREAMKRTDTAKLRKVLEVGNDRIAQVEQDIKALQEMLKVFMETATMIEDEIMSRQDGNVYKFVPGGTGE